MIDLDQSRTGFFLVPQVYSFPLQRAIRENLLRNILGVFIQETSALTIADEKGAKV